MNKKKIFLIVLLSVVFFTTGIFIGAIFEKAVSNNKKIDTTILEDSILHSDNESNKVEKENTEDISLEIQEDSRVEKEKEIITILAVGDMMFHTPQNKSARLVDGSYDYKDVFKYISSYVDQADLVIANYETVSLDNGNYTGYPNFNTPKESIKNLSEVGFNILSTANNHILDQGKKGLISTLDLIEEYGMENIGTSKERDKVPLIKDTRGIKVGYLSYTYGLNGMSYSLSSEELSYMVNLIDREKILEDIKYLKSQKVDFIVSYIHWGVEYKSEPTASQEELASFMVANGVDLILGSHPHVIQKSEIIEEAGRSGYVIYSMGNFISNQRFENLGSKYVEDGLMLLIQLEKNFKTGKNIVKTVDYVPTWLHKFYDKNLNKNKYRVIPIEKALNQGLEDFNVDSISKELRDSFNRTNSRLMLEVE